MAWLPLVPFVPSVIEAIGRAVHGDYEREDPSKFTRELEAKIEQLEQEHSNLQEEGRQQSEANQRLLQQLQQEQEDVKKDLNEQPTDPFVALQELSREKYAIREGTLNVQLTGLTSSGKSYFGNVIAGIPQDSGDRFETGFSECTQEPEARVSKRVELKGMVIHDCPGTGTDGNDPRKAVKELQPAGFNMVLIVLDHALMRADCAVITFCNAHKIPWAIVKSKMDLAIQEEASKSKAKVIQDVTANVKRNLGLRNIPLLKNQLFFVSAAEFDSGNFEEKLLLDFLQAIK